MKKAQGLSLEVIVVAALVLVVLVILIIIFSGKIGSFSNSVEDCGNKGGTVVSSPLTENYACYKMAKKTNENQQYCCLPTS